MVMRGMGAAQKRRRRVVGEKWEQQEESCPAPTGLVAPGFPLDQDHSAEHWDHRRVNRRRLNCEGLGPQRLDRQQLEHQQGLGPQGLGHKGWDQLERDQEEAGRTGQFRDQVQKLESHQRDDVIRCGQGLDQQQPGQELDVQVEGRELERDRDRDRAESRDRDRDPPFKIFRVLEELGQPHVYAFHVIMPARQPSWKEIVRALQQGFSTFLVQMDTTLLHKGNLTAGVPSPLTQSVAQQQFRNWCSIQQPGGQLTLTFIQAAYAAVIEMHRTQSASWPRALLSDFFQFFIQKGIGALRDCTAGNLSTEIQRDSESALFASIFFVSHTLLALEGKNADSRDAKGATKSAGFKASHTSTVITGGDDRCVQNILELKFQATGFLCKSLEGMYDHPGVFQFEDVRRAQDLILMVAMEMVLGLSQRLATDGSINGVQGKSARRDLLKPLLMGILGGPFLKCMPDPTSVNPNSKSSERASKCPRPSDAGKVKMVMETFQALKNLWSRRRQTLAFMVDLISHIMEHNRLAGFSFLMQVVKIVKTTLSTSTAGSCPEAASQDEIGE
ncbi:hypothetical protein CBR_g48767 [Chara braunii]|uniref:Uncharacterized protein n=1 Tax=Chara braunii TaxID=69332 RepID=A0A388M3E1_CHABU|nr:hypothetical protein CBR_g48767 [Chara braunii]|eukprot:GBG89056.1 hypothetical protein CBR_g48767 [Chara braunii]